MTREGNKVFLLFLVLMVLWFTIMASRLVR
jgi:hypothetical protein